jgi:hypothetical protein
MEGTSLADSTARRRGDSLAVDKDWAPRLGLHLEEALAVDLEKYRIEIETEGGSEMGQEV